MRAVVERVSEASVEVDGTVVGRIDRGLLVYLGVHADDGDDDIAYIVHLRVFHDDHGKLNLDVGQVGGAALVVSAFTTQADARKGRRPSFENAARGDFADGLYSRVCDALTVSGVTVARGVFGAMMNVSAINDGPICVLLDSARAF